MNILKKMKIIFIGNANSIHFYRRTEWFAKSHHNVLIISNSESKFNYEKSKIELIPASVKNNPLHTLTWIKLVVDKFKPDLIHAHKCDYPGIFALFIKFSPLIVTFYDGILVRDTRISFSEKQIPSLINDRVDLFTTNSPILIEEVIKKGVSKNKTFLTSFGVDLNKFGLSVRDEYKITRLKKKYEINKNDKVVFSPRVIVNFSNIDIIVKTIDIVNESAKCPVKFLFAGYVITKDALSSFGHIIKRLKHKNCFIWIGKIDDEEELIYHYKLSHIYVSLYNNFLESSPASLLESMASGVLPVMSYLPVLDYWIEDGENGFFINNRAPQQLANIILKIVNEFDKERIDKVINHNYKIIEEKANFQKTMKSLEKKYVKLISVGGRVKKSYMNYDEAILLDILKKKKEAFLLYNLFYKDNNDNLIYKRFKAENLIELKKKTLIGFVKDISQNVGDLIFPESGDISELFINWNNNLKVNELRNWLEKLAGKFLFDLSYLEAVYILKLQKTRNKGIEKFIIFYLKTYKPVNIRLIPIYYDIGIAYENKEEYDGAKEYFHLIVTIWSEFDDILKEYFRDFIRYIKNSYYHLGISFLFGANDFHMANKMFALTEFDGTKHYMSEVFKNKIMRKIK